MIFKHEYDIHEIYEMWQFLGHSITFLKLDENFNFILLMSGKYNIKQLSRNEDLDYFWKWNRTDSVEKEKKRLVSILSDLVYTVCIT